MYPVHIFSSHFPKIYSNIVSTTKHKHKKYLMRTRKLWPRLEPRISQIQVSRIYADVTRVIRELYLHMYDM